MSTADLFNETVKKEYRDMTRSLSSNFSKVVSDAMSSFTDEQYQMADELVQKALFLQSECQPDDNDPEYKEKLADIGRHYVSVVRSLLIEKIEEDLQEKFDFGDDDCEDD